MTLKVLCLPLPFNHEFDDYFWLMSNHLLRYFLDQSINQMFQWFFHFPIFHFHSLNLEHFLITLTTNFWIKVYFYQRNSRFHRHLLVFFQEPAQQKWKSPNLWSMYVWLLLATLQEGFGYVKWFMAAFTQQLSFAVLACCRVFL